MSQNPLLVSRNELVHRTIAALAPAHKALVVNYDCHLPDCSTLIVAAPDLYHLPQIYSYQPSTLIVSSTLARELNRKINLLLYNILTTECF